MKPLFRVRVSLNRFDNNGGATGTQDCNCVDGGVIDGGVIDGGMIQGGFAPSGPLTVETEPLDGLPILPGADGTMVSGGFLSSGANPSPVFGPNATNQTNPPPASSSGSGTQQAAKKRPGSLNVKVGLQLEHADPNLRPGQNPTLRAGQRTVFGVLVENQGDAAIDSTQLQGLFTDNIKPISIIRSSGPATDQLRPTTTNAKIDGQRVIFDKFDQFGPETKHEYQITVEITKAGPGNFEVTDAAGPAVKKNQPITAVAQ